MKCRFVIELRRVYYINVLKSLKEVKPNEQQMVRRYAIFLQLKLLYHKNKNVKIFFITKIKYRTNNVLRTAIRLFFSPNEDFLRILMISLRLDNIFVLHVHLLLGSSTSLFLPSDYCKFSTLHINKLATD